MTHAEIRARIRRVIERADAAYERHLAAMRAGVPAGRGCRARRRLPFGSKAVKRPARGAAR